MMKTDSLILIPCKTLKCFFRISFLSQNWIHRELNKIPAINIVLRQKNPLRTLVVQFDVESRQDEKVKQQTIIKSNLDAYLTQSVKNRPKIWTKDQAEYQ